MVKRVGQAPAGHVTGQVRSGLQAQPDLHDMVPPAVAQIAPRVDQRGQHLEPGADRTALETERKKMNNQESLGDPGGFQSGILTKQNLMLDMTGLTGAQRSMDQYLDYLDEFAKTVKKACDNLINSG